jgi:hypothetical protein
VTPALVAVLVTFSLLVTGLGELARSQRSAARLVTAAEAIAIAAASGGDVGALATHYVVDRFEVDVDGASITVRVWSNGRFATATAQDHRRTLGRAE